MKLSKNIPKLQALIEKAIEDHKISRSDYDTILHLATDDSHIDNQEKALLSELHDMIEQKIIKFTKE